MERIRGNDDDALKSQSAAIRRFYAGPTSSRANAKNADGEDGQSFIGDFTNPIDSPKTQVHGLISVIRKIRQASLNADFINKLSAKLHMGGFGVLNRENSFYGKRFSLYLLIARLKVGRNGWGQA